MALKKLHQLNDRTLKYQSIVQSKREHEYLDLPGKFIKLLPQEVIFPNMTHGRADDLHLATGNILISLEEESSIVTDETLDKICNYVIFAAYMYSKNVLPFIITHKDPKNFPKWHKYGEIYIKFQYIYFPDNELYEKYEKLINKIEQKEELSDKEALDFAHIPKYYSGEKAPLITETLIRYFKHAIITDKKLKLDVKVLLHSAIMKNIDDEEKQIKLMEELNMDQIENEIQILVKDEYGEQLDKITLENEQIKYENKKITKQNKQITQQNKKITKENKQITQQNKQMKKLISQLSKIPNLNKDAQKIINTLINF